MERLAILILFAPFFGGCLDGSEAPDERPGDRGPDGVRSIEVESGTWVLFRPLVEEGQHWSWNIDHNYSYNGPAVLQDFESECAAGFFGTGWVPIQLTAAYDTGGVIVGARQDGVDEWSTTRHARSVSSQGGALMFGLGATPYVVGHAAHGDMLDSEVVITSPDEPLHVDSVGSFWCLVGPRSFSGGSFTVTGGRVEAADLHWRQEMSDGVLIRLQFNAEEGQLELRGPSGEFPVQMDGADDMAFCSREAGPWEISVDTFAGSDGMLTAAVYDVDVADFPCVEAWRSLG